MLTSTEQMTMLKNTSKIKMRFSGERRDAEFLHRSNREPIARCSVYIERSTFTTCIFFMCIQSCDFLLAFWFELDYRGYF